MRRVWRSSSENRNNWYRGIPNNYGGFEQFAEYLSQGLVKLGCEVYVYNSHNHPFQEQIWKGVNIIHKYDPEFKYGTIGQFIMI